MTKWKVTRIIRSSDVRNMCIHYGLYTKGDCEEYKHLLNDLCERKSPSIEDYDEILNDIISHSDLNELIETYGGTKEELMESFMYKLVNDCSYIFVERIEGR